jgi:hypothetical protein
VRVAYDLEDAPRVVLLFHRVSAYSHLHDFSRIDILLPGMEWGRAERLLAILSEHGAAPCEAVLTAPVTACEAIAGALRRARVHVTVDPEVLAAGRAAAGKERAS